MRPFLRYVKSRIEADNRDLAYRIYITDCIGGALGLKTRFADMIDPQPEETRTAEEIIGGISGKLAKIGGE